MLLPGLKGLRLKAGASLRSYVYWEDTKVGLLPRPGIWGDGAYGIELPREAKTLSSRHTD